MRLTTETPSTVPLSTVSPATVSPASAQKGGHRINLEIAIPLQREDLPALSLILLAVAVVGWSIWFVNRAQFIPTGESATLMAPLLPSLFQQKAIPLLFVLVLALFMVAAALSISPLRWWAYIRFVTQTGLVAQFRQRRRSSQEPDDAEAWVAAQAAWIEEYQAAAQQATAAAVKTNDDNAVAAPSDTQTPAPTTDPATDPATPADHTANSESTAAGQTTATPPEQASQPEGQQPQPQTAQSSELQAEAPQNPTGQPAQPPSPDAAPEPATEQSPQTPPKNGAQSGQQAGQQASSDLNSLAQEIEDDEVDLDDLTDVEDILSSFADNDTVSPHLLTLSASIDDVDVRTLVTHVEEVMGDLEAIP